MDDISIAQGADLCNGALVLDRARPPGKVALLANQLRGLRHAMDRPQREPQTALPALKAIRIVTTRASYSLRGRAKSRADVEVSIKAVTFGIGLAGEGRAAGTPGTRQGYGRSTFCHTVLANQVNADPHQLAVQVRAEALYPPKDTVMRCAIQDDVLVACHAPQDVARALCRFHHAELGVHLLLDRFRFDAHIGSSIKYLRAYRAGTCHADLDTQLFRLQAQCCGWGPDHLAKRY
jgi:hypothetical protein